MFRPARKALHIFQTFVLFVPVLISSSRSLLVVLVSLAAAAAASAQAPRLAFDFTGSDPARSLPWTKTSAREPALLTEGWRFGSGLSLVTARNDRLAFAASSDANPSTLAQAKAGNAYLYLRVAPSAGTLDLAGNRISFTMRRESWHAPRQFTVFSSVDGYAAPLFTSPLLDEADDATDSFSFLLPSAGFGSVGGTVEFRIYAHAARYTGHAASLTAFSIGTAPAAFTLSLSSTTGGSAQASPAGPLFESGDVVQLTATPEPGYKFTGWQGDVAGSANPVQFIISANTSVAAVFAPRIAPRMDLGGNLEGLVDWTTAWVFKDCFKLSRAWMTRSADGSGAWNSEQTVPSDADGWPLAVPFDPAGTTPPQIVHTLLPLYGAGNYTVRLLGSGTVDLIAPNGGGRHTITATGGTTTRLFAFNPTRADNMLYVEILNSAAANPIRGIEVIAPGQETNLAEDPFHPAFLASLSPYRLLRFMDWMQTNFSPLASWSERTTATSYTQTRAEGVAHEYIIALANRLHKNPWICLPHGADDNYVRETARLYRDSLDPDLEVYVEYSNETWNGGFSQTGYVQDRGEALGLDPDRWQAGQKYVSRRSGEIFALFAQEYGAVQRHRFVAVLATQAAGAEGVTSVRVDAINNASVNPSGQRPDALAIAPYFGVNYEPGNPVPSAGAVVTTIAQNAIAEAAAWTQAHRDIAEAQGWRLVCYEGGQHFVGIAGAENNDALTAVLHQANRDARMQDRYREYLTALEAAGVDLFANFNHVGEWSKWGSWGLLEYQEQPESDAPKWRAIKAWAADLSARRDRIALKTSEGGSWILRADLRPDRRYAVHSSTDLVHWAAVAGLENLRGDDIATELPVSVGSEPARYWRVLATD